MNNQNFKNPLWYNKDYLRDIFQRVECDEGNSNLLEILYGLDDLAFPSGNELKFLIADGHELALKENFPDNNYQVHHIVCDLNIADILHVLGCDTAEDVDVVLQQILVD